MTEQIKRTKGRPKKIIEQDDLDQSLPQTFKAKPLTNIWLANIEKDLFLITKRVEEMQISIQEVKQTTIFLKNIINTILWISIVLGIVKMICTLI